MQQVAIFLAVLLGLIVVCVSAELLYWRKRDPSRQTNAKEIVGNSVLAVSYKLTDALVLPIYVFVLYDWVASFGLKLPFQLTWWYVLALFLLVDLSFYLTHFCMHKVRWCWASHVTHHSSDRYNFTVALRQNLTVALNGTLLVWWLPMALVGFDKHWVLLMMEINLLYQFLLHTEMPSPLDRLGWVFNTPSHHRVHHGSNPAQIDRNFGGTLIIWDRLFGTFRAEQQAGEIRYGVHTRPPANQSTAELLLHEWRNIWRDLRHYKDWRVLVAAPDWLPEAHSNVHRDKGGVDPRLREDDG